MIDEKAIAYTTAHRDQLKSSAGRAEVRSTLRQEFARLGTFAQFRKFYIDRPDEEPRIIREILTPELRALGYLAVGAIADVERAR